MSGNGNTEVTYTQDFKERATEVARKGSDVKAASLLLAICRQVRRECLAQAPGVPDLSRHRGQVPESALVYEYLPELVARVYARNGLQMMRTSDERAVPSMDHFSDDDLRIAIGEALQHSRFPDIADRLGAVQSGSKICTELLGASLASGNIAEILTSRFIPAFAPDHPAAQRDVLELERTNALRKAVCAERDFQDEPAFSPEL